MSFLKKLGLGRKDDSTSAKGGLYEKLSKLMEGRSESEVEMATGWAGLMGRVANADMDLSEAELAGIGEVLVKEHGLSAAVVDSVKDLLLEHRVELLSIEDHLYARMVNETATKEQKLALLEALFSVAAADDLIRLDEDSTVRTISRSLFLSHGEFIQVRKRFRDSLAVLKKDR